LIYRGTTPAQRTVTGTVAELLARVREQESQTDDPALLVVGEVTRLRDHLRWFDARPLFGRRIILTRSPERARDLSDAIENLGAETVLAPTFRVGPPDDPEAVDRDRRLDRSLRLGRLRVGCVRRALPECADARPTRRTARWRRPPSARSARRRRKNSPRAVSKPTS
jgi:hypothetical protein